MKSPEFFEPVFSDQVRFQHRRRRETTKRPPKSSSPREPDLEENLPAIGTMARTKRLIMAALRVWELKHGIRD
jgi:hypothetical protein